MNLSLTRYQLFVLTLLIEDVRSRKVKNLEKVPVGSEGEALCELEIKLKKLYGKRFKQ